MTPNVAIVDYGMGNVGSVKNMLRRLGVAATLASTAAEIEQASKVILPGVGAFEKGMVALVERGLVGPIRKKVSEERTPVLGICLGMQLLGNGSEEGRGEGLRLIDADFVRFRFDAGKSEKVPHMGWNTVAAKRENPIIPRNEGEQRFYFVHSYYARCRNADDVLATAIHGFEFAAAYARGNVFGVQFHPEKSHKFGLALMKRFVDLPC